MKSAYELAMERLEEKKPSVVLSGDQKAKIAEIEEKFKAKIAALELAREGAAGAGAAGGDPAAAAVELERGRAAEIAELRARCEAEKAAVRGG